MAYNIDEIQSELIRFSKTSGPKDIINSAIMSKDIHVNKLATTLPKIQGGFYNIQALMTHVVQAFQPRWQEFGDVQFRKKMLKNFRQKVNAGITPDEIMGSWIQEKYDEGKDLASKSISQHTIKMLAETIISDVNHLSVHGTYDATAAAALTPTFGASMNGLNTILTTLLADTDNPCFKVPVDAITDNNIVEVVTEFERALPSDYKVLSKSIVMSENNKERYLLNYEDTYGQNTDYTRTGAMKTRLGKRTIVAIPGLRDDVFYTTVDRNFFKLIDNITNPAKITDVQKLDYKLKIFGEFTLGYDFGINEIVVIADASATVRGLGDNDLNKLYYPNEFN